MPVSVSSTSTSGSGRGRSRGRGKGDGEERGAGGLELTAMHSMVDSADHWGALDISTAVTCGPVACTFILPPLSFSRIF
jgi:hypothetical protein